MKEKVICIFIDALRPDFINERDTPYLYKLAENNHSFEIDTILGYSDAIDATIFTGVSPDIHGYWMKYWYNPTNSPFKEIPIVKPLRVIDYIPSPFIKSGINFVLYNTVYKQISKKLGYDGLASFNIPYKILNNFDFTLKKSMMSENAFEKVETIFDILRQKEKTYYYTHGIKRDTFKMLNKVDLGIVYLSDLDFSAHLFGTENPTFYKSLRKLDKKVENIFKQVYENNPNINIIIFSDHGMAEVHKILDFKELIKRKEFESLYLSVLDATMIRFWYFDDNIKTDIRNLFEDKQYGHFLTEIEKRELRIDFSHNKYGDDIYLFDQGYAIYPNFMSWAKPKAMHAYHPKYKEQKGVFILQGKSSKKLDSIKLVDIMPTILNILELEIPNNVEGNSILV